MVVQYETHTLVSCATDHWLPDLCARTAVLFALACATLVLIAWCALRLARVTQRRLSYQLGVVYLALLEALGVIVYYAVLSTSWFHLLLEYVKLVAFLIVGYFFASSALRLTHVQHHKRLLLPTFLGIALLLTAAAAGALWPARAREGCRNVLWLVFSLGQFLYAFVFEVIALVILKALRDKSAISHAFRTRLTRPLVLLALVYGCVSLATLAFRAFLFAQAVLDPTQTECEVLARTQPRWMLWSATLYSLLDLGAPVAAIAWYFTATVQPRYSLSVVPIAIGTAFDETAGADFPAANTRLEISRGVGIQSAFLDSDSGRFAPFARVPSAPSSAASSYVGSYDIRSFLRGDDYDDDDDAGAGSLAEQEAIVRFDSASSTHL